MAHGMWPKFERDIQYSDASSLNTLDICIPRPLDEGSSQHVWILYVHGGAWRDPLINASSFRKIQEVLLASAVSDKIAGYASINYRLSPYPSHSSHPSDPSDPARNAKHPDHITDVLTAILHLQEQYDFDERYVLVGHSCGATLALQVAMKRYWGSQYESTPALELNVVPPLAIVGLEGIYDIPALVAAHESYYRDFIVNAFGEKDWNAVSPTKGDFEQSWPNGQLVVLGHSPNDTLVEMEQPKMQIQSLNQQGWRDIGERRVQQIILTGDHDEVWQTGEAAQAIIWAVQEVAL